MTFLPTQELEGEFNYYHLMRSVPRSETTDVMLRIQKHDKNKIDVIAPSEDEAEQYFINSDFEFINDVPDDKVNENTTVAWQSIQLQRGMSKIAKKTRRGMGNVLLIHPTHSDFINEVVTLMGMDGTIKVNESEHCPEDQVVVYYSGSNPVDQPCLYVEGKGLILNPNFIEYGAKVNIV